MMGMRTEVTWLLEPGFQSPKLFALDQLSYMPPSPLSPRGIWDQTVPLNVATMVPLLREDSLGPLSSPQ